MTMPGGPGVFAPPNGSVSNPLPPFSQPGQQPGAGGFAVPPTQVTHVQERRADMDPSQALALVDQFRQGQQPQQQPGQQPAQGQPPQGGWVHQPVPGQAPPRPQMPQPGQPQAFPGYPPQPGAQPQLHPPQNDPIIQPGPGVPPELVGQPQSVALQYYNVLRQSFAQSRSQQPAAQPQQPAQPSPGQTQPTPPQRSSDTFWTNPREAIREEVAPIVNAAVQQAQLPQQIRAARDQVAATIPGYAQLEPLVLQSLAGMDQKLLADPAMWYNATRLVAGELALSGRQLPAPPQPQPQPQGSQWGQQQLNSQQPMQSFFTEAPNGSIPQGGQPGLSPEQQYFANKFNLPPHVYQMWVGNQS